uniref:Intein C-terminal splicing domain-containing protein n=1 Tax=Pyrodinium bahamense TaxID=73915 RepID=A0A7S0BA89_9DINO
MDAVMMEPAELFVDEIGHPVRGHSQVLGASTSVPALSGHHAAGRLFWARGGKCAGEHEVITLCLDRFHWFYVEGIRVHNKGGCFAPSTLVNLADGTRRAIGNLEAGNRVLSWDEAKQRARNATVASVLRHRSSRLQTVLLEDGVTRITSTVDHPFWSHAKGRLVSSEPSETAREYGLAVAVMGIEETFADAQGMPVRGSVHLCPSSAARASSEDDGLPECLFGAGRNDPDLEVVTLSLEGSHWFFAEGIRVHNKGGATGSGGEFCCCNVGLQWDHAFQRCVPCAGKGLLNHGVDCYEQCGRRQGKCDFCGTGGKCCRSAFKEPQDLVGDAGCGQYEGGVGKHVCVGVAHEGLQHPFANCWLPCGQRAGQCDWCGHGDFCCRTGFSTPRDLRGEQACLPHEGHPKQHVCVSREPSCDAPDVIWESKSWWFCGRNQTSCDTKSTNSYCCCDQGLQWDNGSASCQACTGDPTTCGGSNIIEWTQPDGWCHPSQHLHGCEAPVSLLVGTTTLICVFGCGCFCCAAAWWGEHQKERRYNTLAQQCKRSGHVTTPTTCTIEAARDTTYMQGWYCDSCNRFTPFSGQPFQRCHQCDVDFCVSCQAAPPAAGSLVRQASGSLAGAPGRGFGGGRTPAAVEEEAQPLRNYAEAR